MSQKFYVEAMNPRGNHGRMPGQFSVVNKGTRKSKTDKMTG